MAGVDLELNYRTDIGTGAFTAAMLWNYTSKYSYQSVYGGEAEDYVGEVHTPKHRANLNLGYAINDWNLSWRMRYWDRVVDSLHGYNYNFTNFAPLDELNEFGSVTYHDVSARYAFDNNSRFTLGVRNLFDKQPAQMSQSHISSGTGINTASEAYDVTGRYFLSEITSELGRYSLVELTNGQEVRIGDSYRQQLFSSLGLSLSAS